MSISTGVGKHLSKLTGERSVLPLTDREHLREPHLTSHLMVQLCEQGRHVCLSASTHTALGS